MILGAMTRNDVEARLAAVHADIRSLGVARLDRDVDVLVEFRPGEKACRHFFTLAELLEEHLGRSVELVTPEALSPFMRERIFAEAADVVRAA